MRDAHSAPTRARALSRPARLPTSAATVAVSADDSQTLYVGSLGKAYASDDGGDTWVELTLPMWVHDLLFTPRSPSILYIAGNGGVVRSTDGSTFEPVPGIPAHADVPALATGADRDRTVVYVGTSAGQAPAEAQAAGQPRSTEDEIPGLTWLMGGGVYRWTSLESGYRIYLPIVRGGNTAR